jgi:hypothetical protein
LNGVSIWLPLDPIPRRHCVEFVAGSWQVTALLAFSVLACVSAFSGLYLNLTMWSGKLFKRS